MKNIQTSSAATAGRILVDSLCLHGIDRVFCVPGESYLEVLDALYDTQDQIQLVVAKHEGAAAIMAEADGKLSGRPGICMVTRGPGATHASVGVHIAQQDSTPMILFIGQVSTREAGRDVFQEVDYEAMFGSMAKWVVEVTDPTRMAATIARAFRIAVSGRPGPVVVSLPEDVLGEACAIPAFVATSPVANLPSVADMEAVQALLCAAQRPLIIAGGGGWLPAASRALSMFSARWKLPVACSFRRQDAIDNDCVQYVGHLSLGMNPALEKIVTDADLILAVGTRFSDVATDGYTLITAPCPRQKVIHIHPDEHEIGRIIQPDVAIVATTADAMQLLLSLPSVPVPAWSQWTSRARAAHLSFCDAPPRHADATGVDLAVAVNHLRKHFPDSAIVANGAGNYSVWLHRFFPYRQARTELAPTCGSMGYGLPAAIAASLRFPDRRVVCVAGDGCFMMYPQELATAAEFGAKLVVILVNNGAYSTIRMHQEKRFPGRVSGTYLKGPNYVDMAKAFGCYCERVSRTEDVTGALERALAHQGIAFLELVTDPRQITPGTWIE